MANWEKEDRSVPAVLQDIFGNIQEIIRSEVRLAKADLQDQAEKAARPAGLLGAGAAAGFFAAALLLATATLALATVLAAWLAALIMAVVTGVAAAVLISKGKADLKKVSITPQRAIQNVKENVEWAKEQVR